MSGVAGGSRIQKEDVRNTFDQYIEEILKNIPGFIKASLSGSVKVGTKPDYGDLDLITLFNGNNKKEVKKRIIQYIKSQPESIIVPFKSEKYYGRKYYNSGEIITVLYPIKGKDQEFIQVDNIIALSEEEHGFKNNFLDLPAEKQGIILGLVKVILLEEDSREVFNRLGIDDIPELEDDEELEFNLSSSKLTLRKVKLDNFKTIKKEDIWNTTDWSKVQSLLETYNIQGSFEELLDDISAKLNNPRSKRRIKGIFKSMVTIKSGEKGTPKGQNKEKALKTVDSILEQNNNRKVALYAGGFKPPHKAHFINANLLSNKADLLIIFIGPKVRDGVKITQQQSKEIWNIYTKYLNTPIQIIESEVTPIGDLYKWVDKNKEKYSKIVTGAIASEKSKFTYFSKNKENYRNIEVLELPEVKKEDDKFSASAIRTSNKHIMKGKWIPKEIKPEDKEEIISIASRNAPSEQEIRLEETLERTLSEIFKSREESSNMGEIKEGSSGTHIAHDSVARSEDKQDLVEVYHKIIDTIGNENFDINFNQDHIIVKIKQEGQKINFDYTPYMSSILEHMIDEGMKITPLPEIKVREDIRESANFFGKTAFYNPNESTLVLYTYNRHPKDVMRSFVHEMIHHRQNLEGRLSEVSTTDTNSDNHLLEIEKEAYLEGNITFRNWEDKVKNS